jgi:predicted kinase
VLVGPPGSGKSTFCQRLLQSSSPHVAAQLVRISQDELGSRGACQSATQAALSAGRSVVIDRCNFDEAQRKTWVEMARAFGARLSAVCMDVPIETCEQRVMQRRGHPTLPPARESMKIVRRFLSMLSTPTKEEGFRAYSPLEVMDAAAAVS